MRDCDNPDPKKRQNFEQPVIQTAQMFIGEMGCWLVVALMSLYERYVSKKDAGGDYTAVATDSGTADDDASIHSRSRLTPSADVDERIPLKGYKVAILSLPAICDICGTTLMNVGLLFVVASIFQMTRGALVLFVGLFSVIFLKRRLWMFQWFALVTVVLGVGIVGLAGAIYKEHKAASQALLMAREVVGVVAREARTPEAVRTIVGVLLIAGAQIFTATQFVLEEFILEKYALDPLKVVGWEGVFGFAATVIGMAIMQLTVGRTDAGRYGYFDAVEGWREISSYRQIGLSSILIMISIGYVFLFFHTLHILTPHRGFNFFGLSVTRTVSATSRSTIDTCRTLFIWIVSLGLGWESFKWLQVLGFALLVYGTFLFNGIVQPPLRACVVGEVEELLPEEPIEHM